jgi:transcriptional regulator with XRE-family HTH domain
MGSSETFGQRVRALRKQHKLDQRTLAERVAHRLLTSGGRGFDVTYLSKIENGIIPAPSAAAIIALAAELEADADDLLALAGKAPPDIGQALMTSRGARVFYRTAIDLNLSEQDWRHLLEEARRRKGLA